MADDLKNLRKVMDEQLFTESRFTSEQKQQVIQKIKKPKKRNVMVPRAVGVLMSAVILFIGAYFIQQEFRPAGPMQQQPQFTLTAEEQQSYDAFSETFDQQELAGLEPMSVAKLFIEASANQEHDMMYELYTDREEWIAWSEEEDKEHRDIVNDSAEDIYRYFQHFNDGVFHQTSEYEGTVEFEAAENRDVPSIFNLIQNENGIWQVAFMPIQ